MTAHETLPKPDSHVPTDPRITAATPRAAELIAAVADHDADAVSAVLTAVHGTPDLHALAIVLASWVDPDTRLTATPAPAGSLALANRAVAATAKHYGLEPADLTGRRQTHDILAARAVAAYAAHRLLGVASTTTGKALDRDHSTILNACGRVGEDPRLRRVAQLIATSLGWTREDLAS